MSEINVNPNSLLADYVVENYNLFFEEKEIKTKSELKKELKAQLRFTDELLDAKNLIDNGTPASDIIYLFFQFLKSGVDVDIVVESVFEKLDNEI